MWYSLYENGGSEGELDLVFAVAVQFDGSLALKAASVDLKFTQDVSVPHTHKHTHRFVGLWNKPEVEESRTFTCTIAGCKQFVVAKGLDPVAVESHPPRKS